MEKFPAAISQGETIEEAKANPADTLKLALQCQRELAEKAFPRAERESIGKRPVCPRVSTEFRRRLFFIAFHLAAPSRGKEVKIRSLKTTGCATRQKNVLGYHSYHLTEIAVSRIFVPVPLCKGAAHMRSVSLVISMVAVCLLSTAVALSQSGNPASTTAMPSFLYTANSSENDISGYAVDGATGSLTPIAGSPFAASNSTYMTLDSDNDFAYVGGGSFSVISTFAIDSQTGFLTLVNTLPQQTYGVTGLTFTPHDRFAYVANSLGVIGYRVDRKSGFLTDVAQPQIVVDNALIRGAVNPSGKSAYFAIPDLNSVSAYGLNRGSGTLTAIPGSPFSADDRPVDVAVEPCGQFLYAANLFSNDVSAYAIDRETGSLSPVPGSPFAAQNQPIGIAIDPLGHFVFAVNRYSDNVSVYTIDGSTGSLAEVSGSPFQTGSGPVAVRVDPSGKFVYTANFDVLPTNVSSVSGFALDPTTGALTPVPGSPFVSGRNPNDIAITGHRQRCKK